MIQRVETNKIKLLRNMRQGKIKEKIWRRKE